VRHSGLLAGAAHGATNSGFDLGEAGLLRHGAETSISAGSWEAACASADVALTARRASGWRAGVFALCRPRASRGTRSVWRYCFLNNAAIAAQYLRDHGSSRVAILDVDFHHGNGTQDIFYERSDVLYSSIHGDPLDAFPYSQAMPMRLAPGGRRYNQTCRCARSDFGAWRAPRSALARIERLRRARSWYRSASIPSNRPISSFKLRATTSRSMAAHRRAANSTLFVLEADTPWPKSASTP